LDEAERAVAAEIEAFRTTSVELAGTAINDEVSVRRAAAIEEVEAEITARKEAAVAEVMSWLTQERSRLAAMLEREYRNERSRRGLGPPGEPES
ncbi:MAG: hypothetical protein HQL39_07585, partial [Alphaproteobacteria bacterium]|nr:hypothetical protein [Alphaproteobacteria bacterium]